MRYELDPLGLYQSSRITSFIPSPALRTGKGKTPLNECFFGIDKTRLYTIIRDSILRLGSSLG